MGIIGVAFPSKFDYICSFQHGLREYKQGVLCACCRAFVITGSVGKAVVAGANKPDARLSHLVDYQRNPPRMVESLVHISG